MKLKIDLPIAKKEISKPWPAFFNLGSCFADVQAKKMHDVGLPVAGNPFGVLFNPGAISSILSRASSNKRYEASDFLNIDGTFCSLEQHGSFKYPSLDEAILSSNERLNDLQKQIETCDVFVLTLGTSLVFRHIQSDLIVGNCHKLPQDKFEHLQLSISDCKSIIEACINHIRTLNHNCHIITTVSPIRHLKSGVQESSRSKAVLLSSLHEILGSESNCSYFPAYEIVIDELRDYRFTKDDMAHPTEQASNYVWERFAETYFSEDHKKIMKDVGKHRTLANHRPLHDSERHLQQVNDSLAALHKTYPFLHLK